MKLQTKDIFIKGTKLTKPSKINLKDSRRIAVVKRVREQQTIALKRRDKDVSQLKAVVKR